MQLFKLLLVAGLEYGAYAATIQQRSYSSLSFPVLESSPDERTWTARIHDALFRVDRKRPSLDTQPHAANLARYIDDIVLRFNISTETEAHALSEAINTLYLDTWSVTKEHADVRLHQGVVPLLLGLLPDSMQHSHSRIIHNLAQTALNTFPSTGSVTGAITPVNGQTSLGDTSAEGIFFQDYQPLSVISAWMDLQRAMFPDLVEIIIIGKTYEGRDIKALKIGRRTAGSDQKQTIIVNGAAHAREWISTSTICYMAFQMISTKDKVIDKMLDEFNWIFIPTLNVDGYVYTWESDRLWRKNRQPTSLSFCRGIDLDRSFAFHFDSSPQSASNPCSDMFPGSMPFEATESKAFVDWATNYTSNGAKIVGLLDFHSYSQQILYPYSYSCDEVPPDLENLTELGIGLAQAIRLTSGEHYTVTSACEGSGFATFPGTSGSGSMLDHMYAVHRIPNAYQIKLRDTGTYGFLLPSEEITPTATEAFNMVKFFSQFLLDDGSPTGFSTDALSDEL